MNIAYGVVRGYFGFGGQFINKEPSFLRSDLLKKYYEKNKKSEIIEPISKEQSKKSNSETKGNKKEEGKFDLRFFKRLLILFSEYLGNDLLPNQLLLLSLFPISIAAGYYSLKSSELYAKMGDAFGAKDMDQVLSLLYQYFNFLLILLGTEIFLSFSKLYLSWVWRKKLTKELLKGYFSSNNYYNILKENKIDNPDQRIGADANDFCESLTKTIIDGIPAVIKTIIYFVYLINTKYYFIIIPVLFWPIANLIIYTFTMMPVTKQIYKKDKLEGDLRFGHVRIREHAESMAFFKSSKKEKENINGIFNKLIKTSYRLAFKNSFVYSWLNASNTLPNLSFIGTILILVFCYITPFDNTSSVYYDAMNIHSVASMVSYSINSIFQIVPFFTVLIGNTSRISQLFEQFELFKKTEQINDRNSSYFTNENKIAFHHVDCYTPNKRLLVKDVSFSLSYGDSLLITGQSGVGKSSISRLLAGLWNLPMENKDLSSITKPSKLGTDGIMYFPQSPYLIDDSLKANIIYPLTSKETNCSDKELEKVMKLARIDYLLSRASLHSTTVNWKKKLSGGELQRVQLARLFFHRPKFVILDESTSAVPQSTQKEIYTNIQRLGCSIISISHRSSLRQFHDFVISLDKPKGEDKDKEGENKIRKIEVQKIDKLKEKIKCIEKKIDWELIDQFEVKEDIKKKDEEEKEKEEDTGSDKSKNGILQGIKRIYKLIFKKMVITKWWMWVLAIVFIVLILISSQSDTGMVLITSKLIQAIVGYDFASSLLYTLLFSGSAILFIVLTTTTDVIGWVQGILFRKHLTHHCHDLYFENNNFYNLNNIERFENPDQRITQDIDFLTSGMTPNNGISYLENKLITYFFGVGSCILFSFIIVGWFFPVVVIFIFSVSFIIYLVLMKILSKFSFIQQKVEGNFRKDLTVLKECAEQIAFLGGKRIEKQRILKKFKDVIVNKSKQNLILLMMEVLFKGLALFSPVISYGILFVSIKIGNLVIDDMNSSEIQYVLQNVYTYTNSAILKFASCLYIFQDVSKVFAYGDRVFGLIEKIEEINQKRKEQQKQEKGVIPDSNQIKFQNFTCLTPNKKELFKNLNLTILPSMDVVINGPSGCGKSSSLRCIANLWPISPPGKIYAPTKIGKEIFFLPQVPYLIFANLRNQIIYPDLESKYLDSKLQEILEKVNLGYLRERIGGFDKRKEFSTILSTGEKQKLALSRLIYHAPKFAILDESTSALDEKNEKLLYSICKEIGITCLSIAHRETVKQYHNHILVFDELGGWKFFTKNKKDIIIVE